MSPVSPSLVSSPSSRRRRSRWRLAVWLPLIALALLDAPVVADDARGRTYHSWFSGWGRTPYALDRVERFTTPGSRIDCPTAEIVRYRGTHLRYAGTARVHKAFLPRLERFEELVAQLATEHYGRAPRRIVHRGAFNCRRARGRRGRISEHALGNALDLRGFDFGPLRGAELPEGVSRRWRWAFQVRVRQHWNPRRSRDRIHARFLHRLTEALRGRPDIFRGIVGPPRPRHHDHLHLDVAPWRYAMFSYEPVPEQN